MNQPRISFPHRPPSATPLFPSDPPSEEGSPGEVRARCPTTAAFWPASLATGPAGLPQRGASAGFRKANLLALRRANGRASGAPSANRAGEAGRLVCQTRLDTFLPRSKKVSRPPGRVPASPTIAGNPNQHGNNGKSKSRRRRHGAATRTREETCNESTAAVPRPDHPPAA